MYPKKLKVIKTFHTPKTYYTIQKDEVCEYSQAKDIYTFKQRDGKIPFVDREIALRALHNWFEKYETS